MFTKTLLKLYLNFIFLLINLLGLVPNGIFYRYCWEKTAKFMGQYLNKSPFYHPDFFSLFWLTVAIISGIRKWCR
jgi:hypothetical protein